MRISAVVQSRPFDIAAAIQEAVGLHRQGRLREAEKLYTRVLKAAPGHFDALHLLGLCKAQNGRMGEAYRLMSAALKINPAAPDVWKNFALVLHGLKRDDEALAALDRALALRRDDPDALLNRGNALPPAGILPADLFAPKWANSEIRLRFREHAVRHVNRTNLLAIVCYYFPA